MFDAPSFEQYFNRITKIWMRLDTPQRTIPFCTPLRHDPKFLVIGTNHSNNFDPNDIVENDRIADAFSKELPTQEHTLLDHHHPFAQGLKKIALEIQNDYTDFRVTRDWIGTNRCAIQTDSSGLGGLKRLDQYQACERDMDNLLLEFISFCKPRNIILTGMHACGLFYTDKKLKDMKPKKILLGENSDETTNLIPIWHLSELWRYDRYSGESFKDKTIRRLKEAIEDGFCEL
ncbi:hypothetical protein N9I66_09060 [Pseudomonadales bacterium]|nr:hypothetical protein [Pseudomonadales bacterium]